jgi:protein-S-isoprenylcysteine O-methyltransferase Ste14
MYLFIDPVLATSISDFLRFSVNPLFPNGIDELVCALLFYIWFYFEIINQVFITFKNKNSVLEIKNDKLSLLVIYLGFIVMSYVAGWLAGLRLSSHFGGLPAWTFYIGIGVMLLGEALRQWSIYTLGRFFTYPVMIMKDHRLIIKGPYKFVRHPGYLAGMLTFSGLGLALQSWAAPIAVIVVLLFTYSYRIHFEEQALRRKFGKEYENYAKRTPMIIPHLL